MDDLGNIVYIVLLAIFLISRLFRGAKKTQENQPAPSQPQPVSPTPNQKKEKSLLETIMEEMERQKELNKPKPEVKQKSYSPKKTPLPVKKSVEPLISESSGSLEHIGKEEGLSALLQKMKQTSSPDEGETRTFEFNPREAFMMKTLLERPYS